VKASRSEAVARLCMGDGRDPEPDCDAGTPVPAKLGTAGPVAFGRRSKSTMGSRPAQTESPPLRTCPPHESDFHVADPAHLDTARNSRRTDSELAKNCDPPGSSQTGSDWGVGPFTVEQRTEDVEQAIHSLVASRLPRATTFSPPATGSTTERGSAGRPAPRSGASRTDDRDGPEPGHLSTGRARSERRPARALGWRANGDRNAGKDRRMAAGTPSVGWPNASSAGDLRTPCKRRRRR
jgi:hypothetical protein